MTGGAALSADWAKAAGCSALLPPKTHAFALMGITASALAALAVLTSSPNGRDIERAPVAAALKTRFCDGKQFHMQSCNNSF